LQTYCVSYTFCVASFTSHPVDLATTGFYMYLEGVPLKPVYIYI